MVHSDQIRLGTEEEDAVQEEDFDKEEMTSSSDQEYITENEPMDDSRNDSTRKKMK